MLAPPTPPDPRRDVWHFAVNSYDRTAVYSFASDNHGHSEQVNVKLTPSLRAIVEAIVHADGSPFRSAQDFIRNACIHEVRYRIEKDAAGEEMWTRMEDVLHMEHLRRIQRDIEARQTHVNTLWETLRMLSDSGQQHLASEQVDTYEDIVLNEYIDELQRHALGVIVQMRNYLRTGQGLPELQPEVVEFEVEKKKRRRA
jgi:DNA-binding ferritin-like protein